MDIQSLRTELERQGQLIDGLAKDIQSIKAELKERKKDGLVLESDEHNSSSHTLGCTDGKSSGINEMLIPKFSSQPFKVACDAETRGGGWTIILRRMDGSVDFYRNWTEYKEGFGDLNGEFFLGLDKIHALTTDRRQELLVVLEDNEGNAAIEMYDNFAIGDEDHQYVLHTLGNATGTAGDSLRRQYRMAFSTYDRDNDQWELGNCAAVENGAWWYSWCHESNLAGMYNNNTNGKGVNWITFKGYYISLKRAVMMIRPKE
ncbi:ryncolin-1-like [Drosophila innubila]|uniref:ryncolin-1-like n=1 Tax=Drosophila innubila TaxID=198719 RepID=UPI00148D629E|nr:ryncolin-1-like [Drosophila innubila]